MEHIHHAGGPSLNRTAWSATLHCLTGCAIGEVLGMVIGTYLGWGNGATIALAVILAFLFGYALTIRPLLGAGLSLAAAARLALAADTASITTMEIVDNGIMLAIPGAMHAGLSNERLGFLAHELRNDIQTATLAFAAMEYRHTASTEASAILSKSLTTLRKTIDRAFSEVRMTAGLPVRHEVLCLADFIEDVKQSSSLEAQATGCELIVPEVPREFAIGADRELLFSAVRNLLQNAFKFTQPHSRVSLTARAREDRILIEVRDHCGGLAPGAAEKMFLPFTQSGRNRSGLGLGLVSARRSVEANNGVLSVQNVPGVGCVFSIQLPRRLLPHWSVENSRRNAGDGPSDRASVETLGRPAEKSPMDQPGT